MAGGKVQVGEEEVGEAGSVGEEHGGVNGGDHGGDAGVGRGGGEEEGEGEERLEDLPDGGHVALLQTKPDRGRNAERDVERNGDARDQK